MRGNSMEGHPLEKLSVREWYQTAESRLNQVLPELDEALSVSIEEDANYRDAEGNTGYRLMIHHREKPELNWLMDVEPSMDWIENHLPLLVEQMYLERLLETEDPLG